MVVSENVIFHKQCTLEKIMNLHLLVSDYLRSHMGGCEYDYEHGKVV
jgi:hypothetical protein